MSEQNQADKIQLTDEIFEDRKKVRGVTIDPEGAKDLDDAIWLSTDEKTHTLSVSVADVSALVFADSKIDQRAFKRAFTRYGKVSNDPMLPRALSENQLSLLGGEPRPTLTVSIPINRQSMQMGTPLIERSYVQSEGQFSYNQADRLMREPSSEIDLMLSDCAELSNRLLKMRRSEGALAFFELEQGWATSEEGHFFPLQKNLTFHSHIIIQEFLTLANKFFAQFQAQQDIPGIFRNHDATSRAPDRDILLDQLEQVRSHPEHFSIETIRERFTLVMKRALYSTQITGHYGLNLPVYGHYSSGLRRYPDIPNQANIGAYLRSMPFPYPLAQLQEITEYINQVEYDIKQKRAEYMKEKANARAKRSFLNPSTHYHSMDERNFHRVITVATQEGVLSDSLVAGITQRIEQHTLQARDVFRILCQVPERAKETWAGMQQSVMDYLHRAPENAISLLNMAENKLGWQVSEARFVTQAGGFRVAQTIRIGDREFHAKASGHNKKDAAQRVAVQLLCQITELEPSTFSEPVIAQVEDNDALSALNPPTPFDADQNYIGLLIEYCQQNRWPLPVYEIEQSGSSHQPIFTGEVTVSIDGIVYHSGSVSAKNKKQARQLAASYLHARLLSLEETPLPKQITKPVQTEVDGYASDVNYVGDLQTICQQQKWALPTYRYLGKSGSQHNPIFTYSCRTLIDGTPYQSGPAQAGTKRDAKKRAAALLLQKLPAVEKSEPKPKGWAAKDFVRPPLVEIEEIPSESTLVYFDPDINYIGKLNSLKQRYHWEPESYHISQAGPPHQPIHIVTVTLTIRDELYSSEPTSADSLKNAKQMAVAGLLEKVNQVDYQSILVE